MSKENNNLALKIFALIIAIVLWGYVMSEVNPDESLPIKNVNVSFNNLDVLERKGLVLMNPKEATVSVRVVGKKFDMTKFETKSIKASVDLSGYSEGQVRVPVNAYLEEFSNVRIDKVEPSDILFTFDRLITKSKSVTVKTTGELGSDYVFGDITTKSESIMLKGPRTWVNEVSEIIAEVKVDGRTEDVNSTVAIKLVDDQGNDVLGVTAEPSVIDVHIPIFRTKTVPIELQTEIPDNYEITNISINPNKITLKGDKDIVNLTSVQTKPIDIELLMNNESVPVELELPPNVSLVNPNQEINVSLDIQEAFTESFEYSINEIQLIGLKDGLTIDNEVIDSTIKIEVKGNAEDINALTKEDIEVYIDLSMYDEGNHLVYIGVDLPEDIAIKHITPQPFEVNIISH